MKKVLILMAMIGVFSAVNTFAQYGFGTNSPNQHAIVDMTSSTMGLLVPRVALLSVNDNTTIVVGAAENSMLVYNLGGIGKLNPPGFYFWYFNAPGGSKWVRLGDEVTSITTAVNIAGGLAGSIPYQTGANITSFLGIGTAGQFLQVNAGATAPQWSSLSGDATIAVGGVLTIDKSISPTWTGVHTFSNAGNVVTGGLAPSGGGHITSDYFVGSGSTSNAVDLATAEVAGVLPETKGGTNQSAYAAGDLLYASAVNTLSRLPKGTNGQILTLSAGLPAWVSESSIKVTSFSGGSTGLTPNSATTGDVTLGGVLTGEYGGTGVANTGKTITLGGNINTAGAFTTSGAFSLTLTTTAATNVTFPTTGTLATTSNKLSDFASTTSAELAGTISDETGTGNLVFSSSPALVSPTITGLLETADLKVLTYNSTTGAIGYKPNADNAIVTLNSNTSLTANHGSVLVSGSTTITLPTAIGITGKKYIIKNIGTDAVTVETTDAQTIDGASSRTIGVQWQGLILQSDGANWFIIGTI